MIREQNKPVVPKLVSRDRDKDMPDSLYDDVVKYAKEAFDSKYLDEKVYIVLMLRTWPILLKRN
jgi:hypothetical protein